MMRASFLMMPACSMPSPIALRYLSRSPGVAGTVNRGFLGLGTQMVVSTLTGQSRGVFGATVRPVLMMAFLHAGSFLFISTMMPRPTCRLEPWVAGIPFTRKVMVLVKLAPIFVSAGLVVCFGCWVMG